MNWGRFLQNRPQYLSLPFDKVGAAILRAAYRDQDIDPHFLAALLEPQRHDAVAGMLAIPSATVAVPGLVWR